MATKSNSTKWEFSSRLRRNAFGWRGSKLAIERISQALTEIRAAARRSPAEAGEGAVLFLEKLSPALQNVDSSSGAIGGAAYAAVRELVPLIGSAPVSVAVRAKWLERLFEAFQNDDPPYIESLGDHWGALCATSELASVWADRLVDLVRHVQSVRRQGQFDFCKAGSICYSALFAAGRHDELIDLITADPRPMWSELLWIGRIKECRGQVDEAIAFMARNVNPWTPSSGLARFAEEALLKAGRRAEAYERYALDAHQCTTYLATYRAIARRYPEVDPDRLLSDLIATTPGYEGKWFAAAKTLKRLDLAAKLAWASPCDPRTLTRAARDHLKSAPAFANEVALAALQWLCEGGGYDLTSLDVRLPYELAMESGRLLEQSEATAARVHAMLHSTGSGVKLVRGILGMRAL